MPVQITNKGEVLYCFLSGEIDHHSAVGIRKQIDDAIDSVMPSLLVLDYGGVSFMDSSGIGLVMGRYRNISRLGGKVHIGNPPDFVYKLFSLCAIEQIATIDIPKEKEYERC